MSPRQTGDTRYTPLLRYLIALPPEQHTVTLTFSEIESLIGAPLPASATTLPFWHASLRSLATWQHGWYGRLDGQQHAVTFARAPWPTGRPPRLDHAAIVAGYRAGASLSALGERFWASPAVIAQLLRRTGVDRQAPDTPGQDTWISIEAAYAAGATLAALSRRFGSPLSTIRSHLQRAGQLRHRPVHSDTLNAAIVALYQEGRATAEIGGQLGISRQSVCARLKQAGVPLRPRGRPATR